MSKVYRITVQEMNADGTPGSLVEILETERESWTTVFDFADTYRAEVAAEEEADTTSEEYADNSGGACPDCERPNQFGEMCQSCRDEQDRLAEEEGQRWADEREANGYPFGTIGAETR